MCSIGCADVEAPGGSGGTGGVGGTAGSGPTTLELLATSPGSRAVDASVTDAVSAEFNQPLDASTVTEKSFAVRRVSGASIAGSVTADGANARFSANDRLPLLTECAASLSTAVRSASGIALESDLTWTFTTRDGAWKGVIPVETAVTNAGTQPRIGVDGAGNVTVVWEQPFGGKSAIWANRYEPDSGWGTPTLLEQSDGASFAPDVAVSPDGSALAVWSRSNGENNDVVSSRYTPESGWELPELAETEFADTSGPKVAVDVDGNAVASWAQGPPDGRDIWANRYVPGSGWGFAERIGPLGLGTDLNGGAQLVIDPDGNATAVWSESDGGRYDVWSNRFTPSGGWGDPELRESNDEGNALFPSLAADGAGVVHVVWEQLTATSSTIDADRWLPGAGWEGPQTISMSGAFRADVAANQGGDAIAVWIGAGDVVEASSFVAGEGWGTPTRLEATNDELFSGDPVVAIDPTGNALAVWFRFDNGIFDSWANRFDATGSWGEANRLEMENGQAFTAGLTLDTLGRGIAIWWQETGSRENLLTNRFE